MLSIRWQVHLWQNYPQFPCHNPPGYVGLSGAASVTNGCLMLSVQGYTANTLTWSIAIKIRQIRKKNKKHQTKPKNHIEAFLSSQILKRIFMRIFAERKTANSCVFLLLLPFFFNCTFFFSSLLIWKQDATSSFSLRIMISCSSKRITLICQDPSMLGLEWPHSNCTVQATKTNRKCQKGTDGKSVLGVNSFQPYWLSGKLQNILAGQHEKNANWHSSFGQTIYTSSQ